MAKGNKNTGGYQKKHAVPAAVEQNQAETTEQQESTSTKPAATQPPPVKSVSVQSVTNECIALIQQLPRREQTEVFKNIRRGL